MVTSHNIISNAFFPCTMKSITSPFYPNNSFSCQIHVSKNIIFKKALKNISSLDILLQECNLDFQRSKRQTGNNAITDVWNNIRNVKNKHEYELPNLPGLYIRYFYLSHLASDRKITCLITTLTCPNRKVHIMKMFGLF